MLTIATASFWWRSAAFSWLLRFSGERNRRRASFVGGEVVEAGDERQVLEEILVALNGELSVVEAVERHLEFECFVRQEMERCVRWERARV